MDNLELSDWPKKIEELKQRFPQNDSQDDVFGKRDMVVSLEKNYQRIIEFQKALEGKSGAEAIELTNQITAYSISMNNTLRKLDTRILQRD